MVGGWFRELVAAGRNLFYQMNHFIGVGNNGRTQERLHKLFGVLLLFGPETKPVLDPDFPQKGKTDVGKFIDWTRWLECANGGAFEWGTGAEEKSRVESNSKRNVASSSIVSESAAEDRSIAPPADRSAFHCRLSAVIERLNACETSIPEELMSELAALQTEAAQKAAVDGAADGRDT